jgi:hypothetical protein
MLHQRAARGSCRRSPAGPGRERAGIPLNGNSLRTLACDARFVAPVIASTAVNVEPDN